MRSETGLSTTQIPSAVLSAIPFVTRLSLLGLPCLHRSNYLFIPSPEQNSCGRHGAASQHPRNRLGHEAQHATTLGQGSPVEVERPGQDACSGTVGLPLEELLCGVGPPSVDVWQRGRV